MHDRRWGRRQARLGRRPYRESFCGALDEGITEMRANAGAAETDVGGQLVLVLTNIGEFTTLVHELDETAPAEIDTEMSDARDFWDSQKDVMSTAVTDPVSALATGVAASVFSSASVEAVDRYALEQCGTTVFGTTSPGSQTGEGWQCPTAIEPAFGELEDDFASLDAYLAEMAASDMDDVATAAALVREALGELVPEPRFANEALGRLSFIEPTSAQTLLGNLDEALENDCGAGVGDSAVADFILGLTPAPLGTGGTGSESGVAQQLRTGSLYQLDCDEVGPVVNGWAYLCPPGVSADGVGSDIAIVDFRTGAVSLLDSPEGLEDEDRAANLTTLSDSVAWTELSTRPADGLDPARWSVDVVAKGTDGAELYRSTVGSGVGTDGSAGSFILVPAADDMLIVVGPSEVVALTADGAPAWSRRGRYSSVQVATRHSVVVNEQELVETASGRVLLAAEGLTANRDECGNFALLTDARTSDVRAVRDNADGALEVSPLGASGQDLYYESTEIAGETLLPEQYNGLVAYGPDGRQLWRLGPDVVADYEAVGRWVIVTNTSDEQVLVDAATGADVSKSHDDVHRMLTDDMYDGRDVVFSDGGSVMVQGLSASGQSDTVTVIHDESAIC